MSYKNTEVFIDEFKGYPVFAIWAVDSDGDKTGGKPVVSFGLSKALSIMRHLDELNTWIDEEKESRQQTKIKKPIQQSYSVQKKPLLKLKPKTKEPQQQSYGSPGKTPEQKIQDDIYNNPNLTEEQRQLILMFSRK